MDATIVCNLRGAAVAFHGAKERDADGGFNVAAHGLRGIASLLVFVAHVGGGAAEHVYASNAAYVDGIRPYWNIGTFGVDIFFVISGFVILPSAMRSGLGAFAARRFMRLYPLFFAFSLLFIALNATMNLFPRQNDIGSILAALLFLDIFLPTQQLTPNAWSLTFEVWFYILTALGVHFVLRRFSRLGAIAVGAAILLFLLHYPIAFYFLAGILVRILYDRYEWVRVGRHPGAELLMFAVCAILASRGHYNYDWSDFRDPIVPLLIVSTMLYFLFAVSRNSLTAQILDNPAVRYFGTVSYSLYLVHPYIYYATRQIFVREDLFSANVSMSMTLFFGVTAALSMVVTHVAHRALERWPYERVFHQSIYRDAARPARLRLPWRQRAQTSS